MRLTLSAAVTDDAPALLDLHLAASRQLTAQYGVGPWSGGITVKGVLFTMRRATIYAVRDAQAIVGTFALSQRKPWAIDTSYFGTCKRPLYLTSMAVHPEHQRCGVGTFCIGEARRLAKEWPADAIRLDAWDAEAGAGEFYRKCGFREVGRKTYRTAPLIYFEMPI
jgi:GNAT superfamily N-acetyltransferase